MAQLNGSAINKGDRIYHIQSGWCSVTVVAGATFTLASDDRPGSPFQVKDGGKQGEVQVAFWADITKLQPAKGDAAYLLLPEIYKTLQGRVI